VPVPYFLLFLCFRKATQEIFLELDETKAEPPIFPKVPRSPKMRRRGARARPHPRVARPTPGLHHQGVRLVGPPPDAALSPIYSPQREKPKTRSIFSKHTASRHCRRREIGRVQKLFLAPSRRGESPPEAIFITMVASGVMCE
jgi:hypothetical protein